MESPVLLGDTAPVEKAAYPERDFNSEKESSNPPPRQTSQGQNLFQRLARAAARATGRPLAFGIALCAVIIWAALGPIFTSAIPGNSLSTPGRRLLRFVFLIQNTPNRDSEAVQIKLDELLRATKGCHNAVLDIEELSETELDQIKRCYTTLAKKAVRELRNGKSDLGIPEVEPKVTEREQLLNLRLVLSRHRCPFPSSPSRCG